MAHSTSLQLFRNLNSDPVVLHPDFTRTSQILAQARAATQWRDAQIRLAGASPFIQADGCRNICQSCSGSNFGTTKLEGVLVVLLNTDLIYCAMEDARKSGDVLQRSEFTVRALLESAAQAILAINVEGRLVLANPMVERMFGYSQNELIGQPLELLLPKDSRRRHQDHQTAFFANPQKRPIGKGLPQNSTVASRQAPYPAK